MSVSAAGTKTLARLQGKLVRAAQGFKDYNFRHYFVQHVKDDFAKMDTAQLSSSPEAMNSMIAQKKKELAQMQRMALVNAMYAHDKVVVDHDEPFKIVPKRKKAARKPSSPAKEE